MCGHLDGKHQPACDRKIVARVCAARVPASGDGGGTAPYLKLAADARKQGSSFNDSMGVAMQALLVSPDFLFRIETGEPAKPAAGMRRGPRRTDQPVRAGVAALLFPVVVHAG